MPNRSPFALSTPSCVLLASFAAIATRPLAAQQWRKLLLHARESPAMAYDEARGRIVLFGGEISGPTLDDTAGWNGNRWERLSPTSHPPARSGAAMAYDRARRRVVLFGGVTTSALGDTWEWDGHEWTQVTPAPPLASPAPRYGHGMVYDAAGQRTILFGGRDSGLAFLNDTWAWNGSAWTGIPAVGPTPREHPSMAYDSARGVAVTFGGRSTAGLEGDTWELAGGSWSLRSTGGPSARARAAMTYDVNAAECVLYGGSGDSTGETWSWNGVAWTQRFPPAAPGPMDAAAMAYHTDAGRAVLFGSEVLATTWCWNGATWNVTGGEAPDTYNAQTIAFDPIQGVAVLHAFDYGALGWTTWEWNGVAWTRFATANTPVDGKLVFDGAHGVVLLFGGAAGDETWTRSGSAWTQRLPPTSPPARTGHALAYDRTRGRVVLFGGRRVGMPGLLNDTWEWDGTNWVAQPSPAGLTPRKGTAMSFLQGIGPGNGGLVLTGGSDGFANLDETWHRTGTVWTQQFPSTVPPGGSRESLFHPLRNRVWLLEEGSIFSAANIWEYDGTDWMQLSLSGTGPPADIAIAYDSARDELVGLGNIGTWLITGFPAAVATYGAPCGTNLPRIRTYGLPRIGRSDFRVEVVLDTPAALPAVFLASSVQLSVPIGSGCALLVGTGASALGVTNASGFGGVDLPIPPTTALRGLATFWQAAVLDPAAPLGFAASGGLRADVGS